MLCATSAHPSGRPSDPRSHARGPRGPKAGKHRHGCSRPLTCCERPCSGVAGGGGCTHRHHLSPLVSHNGGSRPLAATTAGLLPATGRGSDQENHQEPSSPSVLLARLSPALLLDPCGVRSIPMKVVEGSVRHCTLLGDQVESPASWHFRVDPLGPRLPWSCLAQRRRPHPGF